MEKLPIKMPNIEKLMDKGVTFTRAVTSSPLCAPARACLAAGLKYEKCRVADNSVDDLETLGFTRKKTIVITG